MKYLYNFTDFIFEGNRIFDFLNPKNDKFINDVPLIKNIKLSYQDIIIKLDYNDTTEHNIIEKIKTRGNLRSISEFNTILEKMFNEIIPNRLNEFHRNGKYEIYLTESKISIIIGYDENLIFGDDPKIVIITIMIGDVKNCLGTIIINDENFLIS